MMFTMITYFVEKCEDILKEDFSIKSNDTLKDYIIDIYDDQTCESHIVELYDEQPIEIVIETNKQECNELICLYV